MPTTIKQALKKWEEATGKKGSEATEVKLIGVYPPIEKVRLSWFLSRSRQLKAHANTSEKLDHWRMYCIRWTRPWQR